MFKRGIKRFGVTEHKKAQVLDVRVLWIVSLAD